MKYKVYCTLFDDRLCKYRKGSIIVDAENEEDAKEKVKKLNSYWEEYFINRIERIE